MGEGRNRATWRVGLGGRLLAREIDVAALGVGGEEDDAHGAPTGSPAPPRTMRPSASGSSMRTYVARGDGP